MLLSVESFKIFKDTLERKVFMTHVLCVLLISPIYTHLCIPVFAVFLCTNYRHIFSLVDIHVQGFSDLIKAFF